MDVYAQSAGLVSNGWRWSPKSGIMGYDYLFRGAFAKWFTMGNAPREAIYMDGRRGNEGQSLSGSEKYAIHFEKGQLPLVKAFLVNLDVSPRRWLVRRKFYQALHHR